MKRDLDEKNCIPISGTTILRHICLLIFSPSQELLLFDKNEYLVGPVIRPDICASL